MQNNILKTSFIVGIIILLNIFINYAISVAYPTPKYENFCPEKLTATIIEDQQQCIDAGGQWSNYPMEYGYEKNIKGYCNQTYQCQKEFDETRKSYDQNVFIILVITAVVLFAIGLFSKNNAVINISFAWAGVLDLIIASVRIWNTAEDWVKLILVGFALAILIYLAYKKFTQSSAQN